MANELTEITEDDLDVLPVSIDPDEIREACRVSIDILAAIAAPHIYKFAYPPYYTQIFLLLKEACETPRDFSKLALGFPRGFSKTTFVVFCTLWAIQFSKKRSIVFIGASQTLAETMLANLQSLLDSPNIVKIFGNWRLEARTITQRKLEFTWNGRLITVNTAGQGASLRGLVRDGARPDLIIMDDIQTKEDARSETISKGIIDWLYSTINFLKSPFGCTYLFLANMYPSPWALLKILKSDPTWKTFIASGITADGKSLWEELHPLEGLLNDYISLKSQGKEDIFLSEIMNDGDLNTELNFDPTKLLILSDEQIQFHQGAYIIIDPSGRKKKSDDTAITAFRIVDGKPIGVETITEVLTPKETIRRSLQLAMKWGASLICAEDVAYQESLVFWFEEAVNELNLVGLTVLGINRAGMSKNAALINIIKSSQSQEIGFTREVALRFADQATGFNPLITNNKDDLLDTFEYAQRAYLNFRDYISLSSPFADSDVFDIPIYTELEASGI